MGTSVLPMQSYADRDNNDDHKKTKDFKSSIIAGSESDKKSASQHQDQDNFCVQGRRLPAGKRWSTDSWKGQRS